MTVFIKRANVDSNSSTGDANGDEYILFMTADPLESSGNPAIVYACVYTRFAQDKDFIMVGEMFEGTAPIVDYDGGEGTGSFTTDRWTSSKDYYDIPAGSGNTNNQETCGNLGGLVSKAIELGLYEGAPTN